MPGRGSLHHLEVWVEELVGAEARWGWLLERLGYVPTDRWPTGRSWTLGHTYLVLEAGPDVTPGGHDRLRPGVNHLAFHGGTRRQVDDLVTEAPLRGWSLMFADRHPYAGGPDSYAAYLEDPAGFEVELVAS